MPVSSMGATGKPRNLEPWGLMDVIHTTTLPSSIYVEADPPASKIYHAHLEVPKNMHVFKGSAFGTGVRRT